MQEVSGSIPLGSTIIRRAVLPDVVGCSIGIGSVYIAKRSGEAVARGKLLHDAGGEWSDAKKLVAPV